GRYDACRGIALLGDGRGNFEYLSDAQSGFIVEGDGKALAKIRTASGDLIVATQNSDSLRIFKNAVSSDLSTFSPLMTDSHAELLYDNGSRQKIEFYYGSGYLSQSTRALAIPEGVQQMNVYSFSGESRTVDFSGVIQ